MDDLIKSKNSSYALYEELLLRRDKLLKDAFQYERAYTSEFGDMILDIFQMKIDCIRKKKTIEYCQAYANRGQSVDHELLAEYLRQEMQPFKQQLDDMIEDANNAKKRKPVSEIDLLAIKRIYHRLVKKIHPDINPMINDIPELFDLWQRIQIAYNCNDKKSMQELELLTEAALEQFGIGDMDYKIEIPDIEEKIAELRAEIAEIRSTDPYTYIYILEDPNAIDEKKAQLSEELKSYEDYSKQLDDVIEGLMGKGVSFTWRMN